MYTIFLTKYYIHDKHKQAILLFLKLPKTVHLSIFGRHFQLNLLMIKYII